MLDVKECECKSVSVWCVRGSVCKWGPCVAASVCQRVSVSKCLCVKEFVCKRSVCKSVCVQKGVFVCLCV